MTASAIVHNRNDGLAGTGGIAGAIEVLGSNGGVNQSQLTVANSTLADNLAQDAGGQSTGAIYTNEVQNGVIMLLGDTITGNEGNQAGGLYDPITDGSSSPIELANTIVAANTTSYPGNPNVAPDCQGSFADAPGGHNLIGDASNCDGLTNSVNGDQVGSSGAPIDPRLAPPAYNGGTTETAPPLVGSPAIGAGGASACEVWPLFDLDQRSINRRAPTRDVCDVGAYDTAGATPTQTAPTLAAPASVTVYETKHLSVGVSATGAPTAALTESGTLPSGVSFFDNGNGTGKLLGTPATGTKGSYAVTITASNGVSPDASRSITLTVRAS